MPTSCKHKALKKACLTHEAGKQHRSAAVGAMMQLPDMLDLLFEHLPVKHLLLSSLVCRAFLQHIDGNKALYFNKYLRWWSFYHMSGPNDLPVAFNAVTQQYEHRHSVSAAWQKLWLTHVTPVIGARVHMRMTLRMHLDQVHLTGKASEIAKIKQQGVASVDALEWEITDMLQVAPRSAMCGGSSANVVMVLVSYVHNLRSVALQMLKSIVVTFENVPVLQHMLSPRELCVMNSVRRCMHCLQRACKWKSLEVRRAEHRVLCAVCMDELFIDECKMHSRWKIKDLPLECTGGVRRAVFMPVYDTVHFNSKIRVCVLKADVLRFLGFASCTELLRNVSSRKRERDVFQHLLLSTRWF